MHVYVSQQCACSMPAFRLGCSTCLPACAAAAAGYQYISPVSGATFVLDTKPANFTTAEAYCNTQGGHLVYYTSVEEQVGAGAAGACIRAATGAAET
jgi:hypothetical protein